ncbi:MAG TPA: hypothetical protein VEY10_11470 [Flavisolibacter sp.]|jgi:YHS domain-containing protein|nr:hypothetical protein [Flavisolibacter sp.]
MKIYLLLALAALTGGAQKCGKTATAGVPSCIQQKIDSIKVQPKWNPPATVYQYTYQGKTVYFFSADCCDQYNTVYDESCNYVCAPSGGFAGRGDGKCSDFAQEAKEIKLVWKDDR